MKNDNAINNLATAAIIVVVIAIFLISGCSQQKPQPAAAATQQPASPQPAATQAPQVQIPQTAEQPSEQTSADPDVYKDNLNQSIDELNQLGT